MAIPILRQPRRTLAQAPTAPEGRPSAVCVWLTLALAAGCAKKVDPQWAELVAALPPTFQLERDSTADELPLHAQEASAFAAASRVRDIMLQQGWARLDERAVTPDTPHVALELVKAGHGVVDLNCFAGRKGFTLSLQRSSRIKEADALAKVTRSKLSDSDAEAVITASVKPLATLISQFEAGLKAPEYCPAAALDALPKEQLDQLLLVDYVHAAQLVGLASAGERYDIEPNLVADVGHLSDGNPERRNQFLSAAQHLATKLATLKAVLLYRVRASKGTKAAGDYFTGGAVAGDIVLVEAPGGRPLCHGTFSASSSDTVSVTITNGKSNAGSAVRSDLTSNLTGALAGAVTHLSSRLSLARKWQK